MGYSFQGWEHDLDVYLTHDPREDAEVVCTCENCGADIYKGERFYSIDRTPYCADCVKIEEA